MYTKSTLLWIHFFFGLYLFTNTASAQNDTIYLYRMQKVSKNDSFTYYKVIPPISEDGHYHVKKYDNQNKLQSEETYKTITLSNESNKDTLDGRFILYDSTGAIIDLEYFSNNKPSSKWIEYYEGTQQIRYTGMWENGYQEGYFYNYYPSGKLKRKEKYKKGKLKHGEKYTEDGKKVKFTPYLISPQPTFNMRVWFTKNLHYPTHEKNYGIEGKVVVAFIVGEDGSIIDIEVVKSPNEALSIAAKHTIETMPKWRPCIKDDTPIISALSQPIMFQLE